MTIEKLNAEVAKAQKTVDDWEAKATAARDEAEELDRSSGAQILENPAVAEKITVKIEAAKRTARAYDAAAGEARQKVQAVYRKHVEGEAKEYERLAAAKKKEHQRHVGEVDKLLEKLRELDGVRYEPVLGHSAHVSGNVYFSADDSPRQTTSTELEELAGGAEWQAKKIRFVLEHGRLPAFGDEPHLLNAGEARLLVGVDTPPVTQAAIDAGAL